MGLTRKQQNVYGQYSNLKCMGVWGYGTNENLLSHYLIEYTKNFNYHHHSSEKINIELKKKIIVYVLRSVFNGKLKKCNHPHSIQNKKHRQQRPVSSTVRLLRRYESSISVVRPRPCAVVGRRLHLKGTISCLLIPKYKNGRCEILVSFILHYFMLEVMLKFKCVLNFIADNIYTLSQARLHWFCALQLTATVLYLHHSFRIIPVIWMT
ncbi:hypothetical protein AGLY_013027 [Aphis glycines]|uniref:Uncharacterized protein n=1 Tax=Aphis glycines TaxID=307491 RepID=A0A6G0T857_APHGL|nr:hypothetical protein AGLY_013027 [Aphis glycines]